MSFLIFLSYFCISMVIYQFISGVIMGFIREYQKRKLIKKFNNALKDGKIKVTPLEEVLTKGNKGQWN